MTFSDVNTSGYGLKPPVIDSARGIGSIAIRSPKDEPERERADAARYTGSGGGSSAFSRGRTARPRVPAPPRGFFDAPCASRGALLGPASGAGDGERRFRVPVPAAAAGRRGLAGPEGGDAGADAGAGAVVRAARWTSSRRVVTVTLPETRPAFAFASEPPALEGGVSAEAGGELPGDESGDESELIAPSVEADVGGARGGEGGR
jgi:hypothetical protein